MKDYYETESKFILFSEVSGHYEGDALDTRMDWDGSRVVTMKKKEAQELFINLKGGQVMVIQGLAIDDYKAKFKEWLNLRERGLCK